MLITATLDQVREIEPGIFVGKTEIENLRQFGKSPSSAGKMTIIGVHGLKFEPSRSALSFSLGSATLFNLGAGPDYVIITLDDPLEKSNTSTTPAPRVAAESQPIVAGTQEHRVGDAAFLAACKEEHLPADMCSLGELFIEGIREFSSDQLHEGQARKWVSKPKNFVAITIQNRNKQFCVHVKQSAELKRDQGPLDIRDDRPGYARFWLNSVDQLDAALKAAKASYDQ